MHKVWPILAEKVRLTIIFLRREEEGDAEESKPRSKRQKYVRKKAAKEEVMEEEEEAAEPDAEAMWGVVQRADLPGALEFLKRMAVPRTADAIPRPGRPAFAAARATLLLVRERVRFSHGRVGLNLMGRYVRGGERGRGVEIVRSARFGVFISRRHSFFCVLLNKGYR